MTHAMIFDAVRTPRGKGKKDGSLHEVKPIDLLAGLLTELQQRHDFDPAEVDDVVMGVVSPVGEQGSVIAKTAALKAGWDSRCSGMQINRFCASGLEAVNMAAQKVASGWEDLVVAGGVESMSPRADRLRRRRLGAGPADQLRDRLRAAGHRRRPDRHARRLRPRGRRPLRARVAAARRRCAGGGPLRPLGDAGRGRARPAVLERDEFIKPRTTLEGLGAAEARLRRTRRDGLRRGRAGALSAGRAHRARAHTPATRRASSTARRRC